MPFIINNHFVKAICCFIFLMNSTVLSTVSDAKWRFNTNEKIVSVGDIHGDLNALVSIMQKAKILDMDNNWIAGKMHFVSTGDILDRGPNSRKIMDLFMKLEKQAAAVGGKVHILLGNHEVMNLIGDRRYVSRKEYASFIPEESSELRKKQYQNYIDKKNMVSNPTSIALFNKQYPPGYFGLHNAFKIDSHYGRWLSDKPFIIVINGKIMVHGGLSESVGELGLAGVNTKLKSEMKQYAELWYWLVDFGFFSYNLPKIDRILAARALINGKNTDNRYQSVQVRTKAKQFLKVAKNTILNSSESPTWYRGTFQCHQYSEQPLFNKVLTQLGGNSVFIGHTITYNVEVESRFNRRAFLQDTGMLSEYYGGQASLLIHSGDSVKVLDARNGLHSIREQSSRNWKRPYRMTNDELEDFLLSADIIDSIPMGKGINTPLKLTLKKDNKTIHAIFNSIDSYPGYKKRNRGRRSRRNKSDTDSYQNEIAAYLLDKLLVLEMVPPVVERKFNGKKGLLQYWIENSLSITEIIEDGPSYAGYCSQKSELSLMKIFDQLINNEDRNAGNIQYDQKEWHLWLFDHSRSFRLTSLSPKKTKWDNLTLADNFRERLESLNKNNLKQILSPYLNKQQINYILKHRDQILLNTKIP